MRSDEFIDLYKQLEDELEVKFSTAKQRRYSSVVFEYINHYESAPVRETLNLCREIRNLMTHNANLGGEPIVEPSEPVVEALREAGADAAVTVFDGADHFSVPSLTYLDRGTDLVGWLTGNQKSTEEEGYHG